MEKNMKQEKKDIDWGNLGFGYVQTDKRYVSNYKDGSWDDGVLTEDANIVLNECAGVLQYAQTIFEGLKAYTTDGGHIVTFRPDLNAERMEASAKRLEMPVFPKERFVVSAPLYVRLQPRHRRKARVGVSVPYFCNSCGTLFQGRRKAPDHTRQRF